MVSWETLSFLVAWTIFPIATSSMGSGGGPSLRLETGHGTRLYIHFFDQSNTPLLISNGY